MSERFTPRCIKRFMSMLIYALPALCCAKNLAPNTGKIDLTGNIAMDVRLTQQGGACQPEYAWHATYGGCRHAVADEQTQREACGADYTGEQVRSRARTQYILQATGQAVNGPWGEWDAWNRSACVPVPRRASGIISGLIAQTVGSEVGSYGLGLGYYGPTPKASPLPVHWSIRGINQQQSTYAVTLDRSSAQLRCVFAISTTSGGGESSTPSSEVWLLGAGESIHTDHGYCQVSKDQTQASIWGDCDWGTGGDSDSCLDRMYTVSILSVSPCSATVEIGYRARPYARYDYSLCS